MQGVTRPNHPRPEPSGHDLGHFTLSVIATCAIVEAGLLASDLGLLDSAGIRALAFDYAGFWPGLLDGWQPRYSGQAVLMFFTYGFLHGGPIHFIVNILALLSLGTLVERRIGTARYIVLYLASLLGGATAYGLLATMLNPMVGASGALFGLAGSLAYWDLAERLARRKTIQPVVRFGILLVILNVVLWWSMRGQLAWEAHLGGILTGGALAALWRRPDRKIHR